jgi:hypothetical protein
MAPPPHVTARVDRAAQAIAAPPQAAASAPIVRVTIGRVDVRAIMTTASVGSSAGEPKAGPVLSLENYLKQRDGVQP